MESVKPETALPQFEYLTAASKHTRFFHYPSFLFDMQNIGLLTKNVYMLLRERSSLSQEKGYIDKNGHVYVIYTEAELAAKNHVSERTIRNALSESGQIEQDADAIILLASDVTIKDHPEQKYYFGLSKNKEGQTSERPIRFNKQIQRFEEYEW